MGESLLAIQTRPWVFFIELFRYLIFGTGLFLAPVLQLAIFTSSRFLDATGAPSKTNVAEKGDIPDIEIMPVSFCAITRSLHFSAQLEHTVVRWLIPAAIKISTSLAASIAF